MKTSEQSSMTQPPRSFKNNNNSAQFPSPREIGLIEKLLHSYGFIQCCYRQSRLFFHFSEVMGSPESLQIGDLVEFQQSNDRRTGKPIASTITKVQNPQTVGSEVISERPVVGVVLAEAKIATMTSARINESMGQIAYEQNGETFFLPFALEDIEEPDVTIKNGEQVEFFITTDERNGLIRARKIMKKDQVVNTSSSDVEAVVYQGVVCSMKENFGFIERADVVREIFFHFTEFKGNIEDLMLGDDNKEVAINVIQIPEGTVIFEDVTKTLQMSSEESLHSTVVGPSFGRILYQTIGGPLEILFGERDRIGEFTLLTGDIVEFYIATDRRDKLQRATNIKLLDATFLNNCEKRERRSITPGYHRIRTSHHNVIPHIKGFVVSLKDFTGYICSIRTNLKIMFHTNELLDPLKKVAFLDEVEFTVAEPDKYYGIVQRKSERAVKSGTDHFEPGLIKYDLGGTQQCIPFYPSAISHGCRLPIPGDLVEFQISDGALKDSKVAINIKLKNVEIKRSGFVADVKDNTVWIDTLNSKFYLLKVGDEIEFVSSNKTFDNISLLAEGTIPHEPCLPIILEGKVVRCINSLSDCHSNNYFGLIQPLNEKSSSSPSSSATYNSLVGTSVNSPTTMNGDVSSHTTTVASTNGVHSASNGLSSSSNDSVNTNYNSHQTTGNNNSDCSMVSGSLQQQQQQTQLQLQQQQQHLFSGTSTLYSFRFCSLIDRRDVPSLGEIVRFQPLRCQQSIVGTNNSSSSIVSYQHQQQHDKFQQAGMVVSVKRCLHARVESIKGQLGTLNFEMNDGSKLMFFLSDVIISDTSSPSSSVTTTSTAATSSLQVGDLIEFVGVTKNNRFTAMGLHKVRTDKHPRPDRIVSRLRNDEMIPPRITSIRAPKGPDGTRGFHLERRFKAAVSS
ncbi:hypothetical protein HELRODRAFT_190661 [Helobdella robusta]|uniref:Uncharacterized protein n=1 Tax=Helobdella robusta TaxID=6412 RepID=T1FS67_HELRO|nr:hypothetical protein HELRODRAFT_190661 [Helobdella robusta]ESO08921.1 hypothetical protein HELRODRAFT_190661 [Helobdella robusta]